MSWADKAHKKYQVEKLVKEVLSNPNRDYAKRLWKGEQE